MLSNMPAPLYALWEQSLHFDAATTSTLFSMYQGGVLVGLLMLGAATDKLGWRPSLTIAGVLLSASSVAFALAAHPMVLGAGRLVSGIGIGIFLSCGAAAITGLRASVGKSDGPAVATLAMSSGLCLGPLTSGLLVGAGALSVQWLFLAQALLLAVASALTWLTLTEKLEFAVDASAPKLDTPPSVARNAIGYRRGVTVMVVTGVICAIYLGIGSSYLNLQLGSATTVQAGLLIALVFTAALGGQVLLRSLPTRNIALWSLAFGLGAALMLVVGVIFASVMAIFASAILSGASQGTGQLAGVTAIRDATSPNQRRRGFGIGQAWAYGLSGALVLSIGWASRVFTLSTTLTFAAVLSGVGIGIIIALIGLRALRKVV